MIEAFLQHRKLCHMLVVFFSVLSFLTLVYPEENQYCDFYANKSSDCKLVNVCAKVVPVANIRENTVVDPLLTSIRINSNKLNGYKRNLVRVIYIALLTACIYLFALHFNVYFTLVVGLVKQRLSIIIFIHNKDGRKGHFPSFVG